LIFFNSYDKIQKLVDRRSTEKEEDYV